MTKNGTLKNISAIVRLVTGIKMVFVKNVKEILYIILKLQNVIVEQKEMNMVTVYCVKTIKNGTLMHKDAIVKMDITKTKIMSALNVEKDSSFGLEVVFVLMVMIEIHKVDV